MAQTPMNFDYIELHCLGLVDWGNKELLSLSSRSDIDLDVLYLAVTSLQINAYIYSGVQHSLVPLR